MSGRDRAVARARSPWFWLWWHAAGAVAVLVVPAALSHGAPMWELASHHRELAATLVGAYLAGALTLGGFERWRGPPGRATVLAVTFGALLIPLVPLAVLDGLEYSRLLLTAGAAIVAVYLPAPHLARGGRRPFLAAAGLASLGSVLLLVTSLPALAPDEADPGPSLSTEIRPTINHLVRITRYEGHLPPAERDVFGGALDRIGRSGGMLLVRGEGTLFRLAFRGDSLEVRRLRPVAPINGARFDSAADPRANRDWFRVADVLVTVRDDSARVLVSHHFWKDGPGCTVVRLSRLDLPLESLRSGRGEGGDGWSTVYDTRPCLPVGSSEGPVFAGLQAGGRLAAFGSDRVIMTVGDHELDGVNSDRTIAQEPDADYGKTLLVDVRDGTAEVYSLGHRNPQGLEVRTVDGEREIWVTEHGPEGGDELNRIVRGANYGWPFRTYGSEYGGLRWPLQDQAGLTDARGPLYAWMPSIAPSALATVGDSTAFPAWRGDFLVGALKDRSVWRTRVVEGRVVFTERIEVGERVRDVVEGPDGGLVLWTDAAAILRLEPARGLEAGVDVFRRSCGECHPVGTGDPAYNVGPSLQGIYRAPVASKEGYGYSTALEGLGGEWTDERLRRFLADPRAMVPGTSMDFAGLDDPREREAVIRYLKSLE